MFTTKVFNQRFGSISFLHGSGSYGSTFGKSGSDTDPRIHLSVIVDSDPDPRIHLSVIVDPDPDPRIHVWESGSGSEYLFLIFFIEIHVGQITILIFVTAKI